MRLENIQQRFTGLKPVSAPRMAALTGPLPSARNNLGIAIVALKDIANRWVGLV